MRWLGFGLVALSTPAVAQTQARIEEAAAVLKPLVESYGVSGYEGPVREVVQGLLPAGAKSEVDTAGNLWVRVGTGEPLTVIIAHIDEIGFTVNNVRDDGTLELTPRGGLFPTLFEGQAALIHTARGSIPAVFAPRDSGETGLRADPGVGSRVAAEQLGIAKGTSLTMPKRFVRLAGSRTTGRSFDDRVGSAALLLALKHLDAKKLKHEVIFVWSVREEVGLEGARAVAAALGTRPVRVYAIDTFVSADAPLERQTYAVARLGQGAVARALDQSSVTSPAHVDSLVQLARARKIALQVGTTSGGNDGSVFLPYGVADIPIGWPLRYSHSPAEVMDLKDLVALADIVQAIAEAW